MLGLVVFHFVHAPTHQLHVVDYVNTVSEKYGVHEELIGNFDHVWEFCAGVGNDRTLWKDPSQGGTTVCNSKR